MIDIKTMDDYKKFINLKQVCVLSGVNYCAVSDKIRNIDAREKTA
jgi:hypothetical protein